MIFQVEKQLKELGDKLPEDKKGPIESALADLKKSFEAKDIDGIDKHMEALNTVFQAASADMYAQQDGANGGPEGGDGQQSTEGVDDEVEDVDFEEVKEE